jgi:hypothetical protein
MDPLTLPLKRLSRPVNPPPFRITDRDIAIIHAIARYRFMTSDHVVRFLTMLGRSRRRAPASGGGVIQCARMDKDTKTAFEQLTKTVKSAFAATEKRFA